MLFYATYQIVKEATTKLLGEVPSPELMQDLQNVIHSVHEGDLHSHHFHLHNYVSHQELTFHIKLDNQLSILDGHTIATEIENRIFEKYKIIATVHIEPLDFEHSRD
jgi:divalent metal cation (Fe/Co/Zn/Cd) transporter